MHPPGLQGLTVIRFLMSKAGLNKHCKARKSTGNFGSSLKKHKAFEVATK